MKAEFPAGGSSKPLPRPNQDPISKTKVDREGGASAMKNILTRMGFV
jgi:hypothetical protein